VELAARFMQNASTRRALVIEGRAAMEDGMHESDVDCSTNVPTVEELLDVDREFRRQQRSVYHTQRGVRRYEVLYSPTSLARRLGRDRDWVLIELEEPVAGPLWTVVSERRGVLKGKRVIRSREMECFRFYQTRKRPNRAA
jgi:hypothetical protein